MIKDKYKKVFYEGIKFENDGKEYTILVLNDDEFILLEKSKNELELVGTFTNKDLKIEIEENPDIFNILNDLIKSEEIFPTDKLIL